MKLLLIDPADFLGGAELFTLDVITSLHRNLEIVLVTTGNCPAYLEKIPDHVRTVILDIPRLRPFRPFAFVKTWYCLRKLVRRERPDLLHSNSVRAGLFAALLPGKSVHFAHDFTTPAALAAIIGRNDRILCCSRAVLDDLAQKGVPRDKMSVVGNGVDTTALFELSKRKKGKVSERPVVSIAGRIDSWKGQDVFLKAAKILSAKRPQIQFRIYGESTVHDRSTREYEQALRKYVKKFRLTDFVSFCGFRPITEILGESDLLVHASIKPEPFGRVIVEALAAGVPVVATDIGGPREILLGEPLRSLLIDPEDPCVLAEKIIRLLENKQDRAAVIRAGLKRAGDFDIKRIAGVMEEEWRSAVSS